jgi:plastocyanin
MRAYIRGRDRDRLLISVAVLVFVVFAMLVVAGCASSNTTQSITTETTSAPLSTVVTQGSGANALGPGPRFTVQNGTLSPTKLEVPVGSAVTWVDADDDTTRTYQFVATDGSFDTGVLGESDTYTFTFQKAGTYDFVEKNDPNLKGSVTVQ